MKNLGLTKKMMHLLFFLFLAVMAIIAADAAVSLIDRRIVVPFKAEKKVSHVKTAAEKKKELKDYKDFFDVNILKAYVQDPNFFDKSPKELSEPDILATEVETTEPEESKNPPFNLSHYDLYGTVVASPGELSQATIYNKAKKKFEIYGLKEYNRYIDDIYEIIAISRDSIEIQTEDGSAVLLLAKDKAAKQGAAPRSMPVRAPGTALQEALKNNQGITKVAKNKYIIDQRLFESMTNDMSLLMTQIGVAPKMNSDKQTIGYEIRRIMPGSHFQKIGLRRGDVVKSINDRTLSAMTLQEALKLLDEMKRETYFNVGIQRNNKEESFGFEVR